VRCRRCGNDNSDANRFCGMCGAPLVPTSAVPASAPTGNVALPRPAAATAQSTAIRSAATQTATRQVPQPAGSTTSERRSVVPPYDAAPKTGPVITGPSFLGLSTPGPASDRHSTHDPLPPSSGNLEYLLEDEEEPKRGWGKLILVLVALALALGFGYLHYKRGGFDWLNASNKKPAATLTPDATPNADSSAPAGSAPQPGATANATPPPATAPTDASGSTSSQDTTQAPNSPNNASPNNASPNSASPNSASPNNAPPDASQNAASQTKPETKPEDSIVPKNSTSPSASADSEASTETTPAPAKSRERKPAPVKPAAAKPYDPVAEAERYIYGRGARQDCDHGMRLLKTAAQQSNPKAMISMGAVYSTGTCTPRDLPTAYRWFAQALHKQPDNQALQDDLKNLWEKMTQPERQLAIKLSQ
jgi:hypothetical protein